MRGEPQQRPQYSTLAAAAVSADRSPHHYATTQLQCRQLSLEISSGESQPFCSGVPKLLQCFNTVWKCSVEVCYTPPSVSSWPRESCLMFEKLLRRQRIV